MIPVVWQTFIRFPRSLHEIQSRSPRPKNRSLGVESWGGSTESVALESMEVLYTNGIVERDIRIYIYIYPLRFRLRWFFDPVPCYLSGFCVAHGRSGLGPGPYNCPGTWLPLNWPTLSGIQFLVVGPGPHNFPGRVAAVELAHVSWPNCACSRFGWAFECLVNAVIAAGCGFRQSFTLHCAESYVGKERRLVWTGISSGRGTSCCQRTGSLSYEAVYTHITPRIPPW